MIIVTIVPIVTGAIVGGIKELLRDVGRVYLANA